ncbi:uncharacterized protein LOC111298869 [Durio zibethinus]|uniref:Uncharacterized protein LOC111298869 n=1 Tax=Durio zibethinus TaxID=66656 RepID=A0A6P5Z9Z5_DURZI|nr:uncharacterized protein LOC111298869 [Durio zibethinus]XP_022749323.1 uncharacterized protein LOC111298869 [Durio zibethinus]
MEYASLAAENRHLKGIIEGMISNYLKVPGKNFQKHENYVSHSTGHNDLQSFYAQDQQGVVFDIGGNAEELNVMDGLELNELLDDPLSNEELDVMDGLELNELLDDPLSNEEFDVMDGLELNELLDDPLSNEVENPKNSQNKKRAATYEDFKDYVADAKDFYGKSVSTGLFP